MSLSPLRILVTRRLPTAALVRLRAWASDAGPAAEVAVWESDDPIPRDEFLARVGGANGLVCLLTDQVDAELFKAAGPGLRVVSNVAVGFDNIDVNEATRRGILVTNTPGVLTETTADLAWALILAACRRLPEAIAHLRDERWQTWRPLELAGLDVHGATLGVVGAGRIGQAVARRAGGFGMRVIYHSRSRRPDFESMLSLGGTACRGATGVECDPFRPDLDDLLREADIVSLHVPLDAETHHLIGSRELALMKPTGVLVNTARGSVVDEAALVEALSERRIFSAGLDVFEREPLPSGSPLRRLDNVVLLPHVGSASIQTRTRMAESAVASLISALEGRRPDTAVNNP